ncbi:hypothetical protein AUJ68_02240 [Candidatus Woesearchaeota archaeon CG1_02_57_44]|nr:MAG: hypothetical protein AUJ68_02240 [Candidatus Woesearchaeota archaeon CG1_02_57_44]
MTRTISSARTSAPASTFLALKKEYLAADTQRESVILQGRRVISASKRVIRDCLGGRQANLGELESAFKCLQKLVGSTGIPQPSYRAAAQEYCEAVFLAAYVSGKALPGHKILGCDAESYILGLCDLSGEIFRYAVNSALAGDFTVMERARLFLGQVYDELSELPLRGDARRKFDGIKYDLNKMDDHLLRRKSS